VIFIIVACYGSEKIAKTISQKLNISYSKINTVIFPDGELDITFTKNIKNKDVFLVSNFQNSKYLSLNDKIIEVLFAIHTAKDLKARKIYLIAPYFPYFRSDQRFRKDECVSIKVINKLFSVCDKIFCVAPHLHRIKNIKNALKNAEKIDVDKPIIKFLKNKKIKDPIFLGPDIESLQWIKNVSKAFKSKPVIALKERKSAKKVVVSLPKDINVKGRDIIIIDDIISTGNTIIENIKQLKKYKPRKIIVIGIHGLFVEKALQKIRKYSTVFSTNTVLNKVDVIDVSDSIVEKIIGKKNES
jgi:ribose-phosphate pyrophosphokinase